MNKEKVILRMKIKSLKQKLASTDYKCLKYLEGHLTLAEYEPIKAERQKLRNQINELEEQL